MRLTMRAGKQSDTSIACAARPACRAIAQASHPGRSLPLVLVTAQHGHGSMPDRNIVSMIMLDDVWIHDPTLIWMSWTELRSPQGATTFQVVRYANLSQTAPGIMNPDCRPAAPDW